jgi:hypothetical protein
MRSPIEEQPGVEESPPEQSGGRSAAPPVEPPPGGKALQRLIEFETARGLRDDEAPTPSEPSMAAPLSGAAASTGVSEWAEAIAATELAGPAEARATAVRTWQPLGPTVMHNGQTYGQGTGSRVDVAGRVSAIAVDPSSGSHLLVGSAGGGIWESSDQGATWAPRGDGLAALAIGALAFDPHSPRTVYAGTGEGDAFAGLGQGVYRSTDGGTSWTLLAGSPFIGVGFHRIVVDPADGSRLYAATRAGIHVSSDGGSSWTRRRTEVCWSISVHPSGGATEVLAGCTDGLFRSTDSGATWTAVTLTGVPTPAGIQRLAVSHAPSNGAVAWVWAATNPPMAIPGGSQWTPRLWRRGTAGGAFTAIGTDPAVRTGQAWYDWHAHAAPNSDTTVYLGEINLFRVDRSGNGWVWTNLSSKTNGDSIHPDQHCMAFDPQDGNVVYAGCDGGIYRSPNRGTNWADLNDGLAITEIEYLAHDIGSSRWLLAGTQDNGSIRFVGRSDWDHVADGDGGDCGSDSVDANRVYHSFFRMGFERSSDKGTTWTWTPTGNRDPNVYGQLFYPPLEANGSTMAQAGESVFVSRNNGAALTEVLLPGRPTASAMYMPSPDQIYVGTRTGRLFRISWSGGAWAAPVELTSPRGAFISDVFVDPANSQRLWLTYSQLGGSRVWRSDDAGSSWSDRSSGLPALPINAVEVHPGNADRVWVAADKGVYESFDGGASWSSMSLGLPNCIIADLLYHRHAHVLRAGTRNRGVWELVIDQVDNPICGTQWTGSLAPNETRRWFTFRWPATWHVVWTVMPTTVIPGAPEVWWDVQVERAESAYVTYWITVRNLTNQQVAFEGRYAILSYR